jgi:hypothetical protein
MEGERRRGGVERDGGRRGRGGGGSEREVPGPDVLKERGRLQFPVPNLFVAET